MEFKPKKYKLLKLKNYIISEKKFIIYNIINSNLYNLKILEKKLKISTIKYYKLSNKLIFNSFKNSIFKNITIILNNPIIFINKFDRNYKLSFICLKLNNKIYSKKDLKNLNKINYKKIFYTFNKKLFLLLKKSFNKLIFLK